MNEYIDRITGHLGAAIEDAAQVGRDEMAKALADFLAEQRAKHDRNADTDRYLDGIQEALSTLIDAGATDPR